MSEPQHVPSFVEKIPPGTRVRYCSGKYEPKDARREGDWFLVPGWIGLPWAYIRTGTTISDLEAQGADWQRLACPAWCVPDFATGVRWDGEERGSWVRSSLLEPIGFEQAHVNQMEMFA